MNYLKIPFNTKIIMEKQDVRTCDIDQSIKQHIHLMLTTYQGEYRGDFNFGNKVWEDDFLHTANSGITEKIKQSLKENIEQFEKRLLVEEISIKHYYETSRGRLNNLRRRVDVEVRGKNKITNTDFLHQEHFYIAPLSY